MNPNRQIMYQSKIGLIEDWVKLPTKKEMDAWRDKNTPGWNNKKYRVVTKVTSTPTKRPAEVILTLK